MPSGSTASPAAFSQRQYQDIGCSFSGRGFDAGVYRVVRCPGHTQGKPV
jgi:hypothetical protein